jgi:23S rRNA pseudouridine955/2504/2580 synthase
MEQINHLVRILEITQENEQQRIDNYLRLHLKGVPKSMIYRIVRKGEVRVNKKRIKPEYKLQTGDLVRIPPVRVAKENSLPSPKLNIIAKLEAQIVYEDDALIILNKPSGLAVHGGSGLDFGAIEGLRSLRPEARFLELVHRLDKATSGLLLVAKDPWVHSELAKQFSERTTEREYWAVCWGTFDDEKGEIIGNIARSKKDRKIYTVNENDGKYAETHYEVIDEYAFASLVKLNLKTGRTHQIRVHMNYIKHPIFGDHTYNGRIIHYGNSYPKMKQRVDNLLTIMDRQALHAKTLGFTHPKTKERLVFNSELPDDMKMLIKKLEV